jgi:hypothetical protein
MSCHRRTLPSFTPAFTPSHLCSMARRYYAFLPQLETLSLEYARKHNHRELRCSVTLPPGPWVPSLFELVGDSAQKQRREIGLPFSHAPP